VSVQVVLCHTSRLFVILLSATFAHLSQTPSRQLSVALIKILSEFSFIDYFDSPQTRAAGKYRYGTWNIDEYINNMIDSDNNALS
jgi:hypothetical protein